MNEVKAYIDNLNAQSAAWVAEDPTNRWAGELVNDPAHWAGYGITTVAGLEEYFDACAEKEARKASYIEADEAWEAYCNEVHEAQEAELAEERAVAEAAGPYGEYEDLTDPCNW